LRWHSVPVSAALFFGGLIPIAVKAQSGLALPLIYGIGTGLPVLLFAFVDRSRRGVYQQSLPKDYERSSFIQKRQRALFLYW
jgi:hypothetical protein